MTTGTVKKSWRDDLPIHPAADLFPLMSPDELKVLGEDIKKNGLLSRVAAIPGDDGKPILIDGRNRLDAMELVGLRFKIEDVVGTYGPEHNPDLDPYAYVVSANIHRRHLTTEQKLDLIAKLRKASPEKSNRQIAEMVKASPTTVGKVTAKLEAEGDVSTVDTRTDTKGRQQPARRGEQHSCWQCGARAGAGDVQKHHYDGQGYDGDVWLHDSCVATFEADLRKESSAAYRAEQALTWLDEILRDIERHPDWLGVDRFGERLLIKASALIELAQRPPAPAGTPSADGDWPDLPAFLDRRARP
jgi:DNA-binding Lrp family transcriptional regulator